MYNKIFEGRFHGFHRFLLTVNFLLKFSYLKILLHHLIMRIRFMGHSTTVHTDSNFDSVLVNFLDTLGYPHDGCSCRCPMFQLVKQFTCTFA